MIKSSPLPNGSVVLRPQRRRLTKPSVLMLITIFVVSVTALALFGLFTPTRLAFMHERTLSVLHGGVANTSEELYVDSCVWIEGAVRPQAVTRTQRTVMFRDGTSLDVRFSGKPTPTNGQCP